MPTPTPNSRVQILEAVTDRHIVPVQDLDREDLTQLAVRATAFGVAAGAGAPTDFQAAVQASYLHNSAAANADLTFTAVKSGTAGNNFNVEVLQPVTTDQILYCNFDGTTLTINLPTDGGGSPVAASATEVKAAVDATLYTHLPYVEPVTNYITVTVEGTGAGTVDALASADFTGGLDHVAGSGPAYLYVDTTTPGIYANTGTLEEPAWTAV